MGWRTTRGFRTVRIEAPEGSSLPELLTPELRRTVYALDLRQAASVRLRRGRKACSRTSPEHSRWAGRRTWSFSVESDPRRRRTPENLEQESSPPVGRDGGSRGGPKHRGGAVSSTKCSTSRPSSWPPSIVAWPRKFAQRNLPFLFIAAGLPQVAALAGEAKSYAERLFDLSRDWSA